MPEKLSIDTRLPSLDKGTPGRLSREPRLSREDCSVLLSGGKPEPLVRPMDEREPFSDRGMPKTLLREDAWLRRESYVDMSQHRSSTCVCMYVCMLLFVYVGCVHNAIG